MTQINTHREFRNRVRELIENYLAKYEGSLEDYLKSLWSLIEINKSKSPSLALFVELFEGAFQKAPLSFEEEWLNYENPLPWNKLDREYVLEGLEDRKIIYLERNVDPYHILKHTLLFQIADLYRMRRMNQLDSEFIYMGIKSPSGNYWYNFDVGPYLKIGTGGDGPYEGWLDEENPSVDWGDLAGILEAGRLVE